MTKKRDEVVVPATAAQLGAVAKWIRQVCRVLRSRGPSMLGEPVAFEAGLCADEQVAVLLEHLARWPRKSVQLPRSETVRIGAMQETLVFVLPSPDSQVWAFIARCRRASGARPGRPRLTVERLELRVSEAIDDPDRDERTVRRLKKRLRLHQWMDRVRDRGETVLTSTEPPPR